MNDEHFDIFKYVSYRVFEMNESWDWFIFGMKGKAKSSTAYSVAKLLNPDFDMAKWAFTTEEWIEIGRNSGRGDVVVFDEQGTQESGSSYDFRSKDNKAFADEVQMNRTDGVINIGISLGTMRVINRVRNQYKVFLYPRKKLSNSETGGNGLYTECLIKYVDEIPFPDDSNDDSSYKKKYFKDFDGSTIKTVLIPHPSEYEWKLYSKGREAFRQRIRENAIRKEVAGKTDNKKEDYAAKIERLNKLHMQTNK